MHDFYYGFWNEKKFPGFRRAILELEKRSVIKFNSSSHTALEKRQYKKMLNQSLDNIEKYFCALVRKKYIKKSNYIDCLNQIKTINSIDFMDKKDGEVYDAYTLGNDIYLNPNYNDMTDLNHDDTFLRITCHEFTHHMNSFWKEDRNAFCVRMEGKYKKILQKYGLGDVESLRMGIELLGEVIAEDISEEISYGFAKKRRPDFRLMKNEKMYGKTQTFLSNFYVYQELQEVANKFACCLDFIKDSGDISTNLRKLSEKALFKNFISKIEEVENEDLIIMLACMGKIKEASYTASGLTDLKDCDVRRYLNTFNYLSRLNHKYSDGVKVKRYS